MAKTEPKTQPKSESKKEAKNEQGRGRPLVALVLQGGGALGAYHSGCFKAMVEEGYEPDWVSGISIGAVTAALIAGNKPDQRLPKVEEFWDMVSRPGDLGQVLRAFAPGVFVKMSAAQTVLMGQPNFFSMRVPPPQFALPGTPAALSYADNSPLRDTLLQLADFDYINSRQGPRLSLGATEVTTGNLVFFDSARQKLAPDHVMASGALPPGFPPMRIGDRLYWDGGCATNTPLEAILDDEPDRSVLVFMIDLFDGYGPEPRTMDDVMWRQAQIQYASRTTQHLEHVTARLNARRVIAHLEDKLTPGVKAASTVRDALSLSYAHRMDIVHVTYHPGKGIPPEAGHEFSRASIIERAQAGYDDLKHAMRAAPWSAEGAPVAHGVDVAAKAAGLPRHGAVIHHVRAGTIKSRVPRL